MKLNEASSEYLARARRCILLVDVCSQMSRDWIIAGKPYDDPKNTNFTWTPKNLCGSDPDAEFQKYTFHDLIWSSFRYGPFKNGIKVEPAAFIAHHEDDTETAYLIFRGSQTGADFGLDFRYDSQVNPMDNKGGRTEVGFSIYFTGCGIEKADNRNIGKTVPGITLHQTLRELRGRGFKNIIVSGHSLGSTAATLSVALLAKEGWCDSIVGSVSASPMVGDADFKSWFDSLKDQNGNKIHENFTRLTNSADGIPQEPNKDAPDDKKIYVEVGANVEFTADYQDGGKNHNPCCTYSYALHNPNNAINPNMIDCVFPVGKKPKQYDDLDYYEVQSQANHRKPRIFKIKTD